MRFLFPFCIVAVIVSSAAGSVASAQTKPVVDKINEVGPAISACWRAPPGSSGWEMTVVFTLNRKGEIFGKPRVTYSKLLGAPEQQKEFVASVFAAIEKCTPLNVTEAFGAALAGKPFAMKFSSTGRETPI